MPTTSTALSGSILYRDLRQTLVLIEAAAKEWADRAARHEELGQEATSLLAQMARIGRRSPEMMRDLWDWAKAEELAERVPDRRQVADEFREQFRSWLHLLGLIQQAARRAEAEGYPVTGADELDGAAAEMQALVQEVNETWPTQELGATSLLTYEELRSLAERFPPPGEWYQEKDDLF